MLNKFSITLFLAFFIYGCVQTSAIKNTYQDSHEWIGKKIIFLPKYESVQKYGYQNYSYWEGWLKHPSYNGLVGKTAEIIGCKNGNPSKFIVKTEEDSTILYVTAYGNHLNNIAFLSEMENAYKFIGKIIWNKSHPTDTNADRHGYIRCQRSIGKFEELIVTGVKWGFDSYSPLKFYLRTKDGIEAYWEGSYSKINDSSNHLLQPFEENWYAQDPHELHPEWSRKIWGMIENSKVSVGMTDEQTRFSWGEPNKINKSIGSWGVHEQWIYGDQYLYFENGLLTSLQTN